MPCMVEEGPRGFAESKRRICLSGTVGTIDFNWRLGKCEVHFCGGEAIALMESFPH